MLATTYPYPLFSISNALGSLSVTKQTLHTTKKPNIEKQENNKTSFAIVAKNYIYVMKINEDLEK